MTSIRVWAGIGALAVAGAAFGQQGFDAAQFQKQMEAMQKALQANAAAAQPVVDFRQLKALLPESIGEMKRTNAKGEKTAAEAIDLQALSALKAAAK